MQFLDVPASSAFDVVQAQKLYLVLAATCTLRRDTPVMLEYLHLQTFIVHPVFVFPMTTNTVTVTVIESLLQLPDPSRMLVTPTM